jgi:CheY-like chemotaxis protein
MKVLICDDEFATRLITKSYLDMHDVETLEAPNGEIALEIIDEESPDLLIIDYSMPGMTGLEVLKEINKSLPSIILTSEGFTMGEEKEIREFASEYLAKPITEETLVETIEKITGITI